MKRGVKKKILIIICCFFVLAGILFTFTNLYKIILSPLNVGEIIKQDYGDVILVLGGGLRKGLKIGYSTRERLDLAISLYREKRRMLIVSDGSLYRGSRAIKVVKDYLALQGVKREDIIIEGKSQTTYENFINTKGIIDQQNRREVIICTSPYHQKRTDIILHNLRLYDYKIALMKNSEINGADSIKQRYRNLKLLFNEYGGIIKFILLKR